MRRFLRIERRGYAAGLAEGRKFRRMFPEGE
jgi:hypothetical protein